MEEKTITEWLDSTASEGTYVEYSTIGREELMAFLEERKVHSVFSNYEELIEKQVAYKDDHLANYRKKRATGKTYKNIYAHRLTVMLPTVLPRGIAYADLIRSFLYRFDIKIRERNLLWVFSLSHSLTKCTADIILFSRPFRESADEYERYEHDYWWNPETETRGHAYREGNIRLRKRGEIKLDKDGNPIKKKHRDVSSTECHIFKYAGVSGFKKLFAYAREVLRETLKNMIADQYAGNCHYFKLVRFKKGQKKSTLYKKILRNDIIRDMNRRLAALFDRFSKGGLDEDEYLSVELRRTIQKIRSRLYDKQASIDGVTLSLGYNIQWNTYKANMESLRQCLDGYLNELDARCDAVVREWYEL